ncbi:MAG: glutamine-hydrolyzing carbamoyl-phosphate synthase small subunit [Gammaproteobacteria bacterium]|nr:glutamine-hydrolyzing carbamoyl-phosphate synthase small subunit [Gammaproteobacteria bacterium]MBT5203692.1 glutamine-hydrolyzing carbamoyl-phosphate synthase small subunit [Gammaproteobacteria bacterium]MBT5602833.1 glutamine-hydrolyzing carbamoyl-phosphate synthase small subunit [Gammaproteobacteria bacterium]MBT6246430.1 glutamine-hydrolyzing carbamoyl-phosphate synthase small subunit [Gammaproteobacteria bacterium]
MVAKAVLVLASGDIFEGIAIGAMGSAVGEVVFNTAMTGYQEILTDPSYCSQIVTLTHPHIGNTGCNPEDNESSSVWASGLIVRDLPLMASNWRNTESLEAFLVRNNVVALAEIDTRQLTRLLRDKGSQNACILAADDITPELLAQALDQAKGFSGLEGLDLAERVSTEAAYPFEEGTWRIEGGSDEVMNQRFKVIAFDYGVKRNILRMLVDRGCSVTVVPARTSAQEVLALNPDGIFLSNGPGDPEPCDYAISAIQQLLETDIPVFGICLGMQLLGLAAGLKTKKMKHGHHGANHPVRELSSGEVLITSQNHGFCIDDDRLPANIEVTHRSLFDQTVQGVSLTDKSAFGFQGHPEASPGPHDAAALFEHFIAMMERAS